MFDGISYFLRVTVNKLIGAGRIAEVHKGAASPQAEYDRRDLDRRAQHSDQRIWQLGVLRPPRLPVGRQERGLPGRDEIATRPELAEWPFPPCRCFNDSISFRFHVRSIDKATKITQTKTEQKTAESELFAGGSDSLADSRKNIGRHGKQNLDEPRNASLQLPPILNPHPLRLFKSGPERNRLMT